MTLVGWMALEHILSVKVSVTIDAMLNFDVIDS